MVTKTQVEEVAKLLNAAKLATIKLVAVKEVDLREAFMSAIDVLLDASRDGEIPPKAADVYNQLVEEEEGDGEAASEAGLNSDPEPEPEAPPEKKPEKKAPAKKEVAKKAVPEKKAPVKKPEPTKPAAKKAVEKKAAPVKKAVPEKKAPAKPAAKAKVAASSIGVFAVRKGSNAEKQLALLTKAPIKMKDMEAKTGRTCYSLIHQMVERGMKLTVTEDKKYFLSAK
jgi:outer membrane biosynthesis protein TonB